MAMAAILDKRKVGPVTILELGPRLTGAEVHELNETIKELLEHGSNEVLFDCSNVNFIDSLGIGAVVRSWVSVEKKGKLRLLGLSPRMREILQIIGLMKVMVSFDDIGEALRSF